MNSIELMSIRKTYKSLAHKETQNKIRCTENIHENTMYIARAKYKQKSYGLNIDINEYFFR